MIGRKQILLFILLTVVVGCQQKNEDSTLLEQSDADKFIEVKDSSPEKKNNLDNEQIASHLARVASEVPDVRDAAAVVAGPYAVVGIDVNKEVDRQRIGSIKYTVTEALQDDPYGKTAVVVADADMTERLRGMADKIQEGYPIQGIVTELATIVGRYMPEMPINDNTPEEPDENKENISDQDEKKLEDIQKEQSKER